MSIAVEAQPEGGLLASLLSEERFYPSAPTSIEQTDLSPSVVEGLICKYVSIAGTASGRDIADHICLPFGVLEDLYRTLRSRQILCHTGAAPLNDYFYKLTDQGQERTQTFMDACSYCGPAPVQLNEYIVSVEAQTIRAEAPKRPELEAAFADILVPPELVGSLGPVVNSAAGCFLYGAPGNGKSTVARRLTACFGQHVWIPHTIIEDNQIIKLYDPAYHQEVVGEADRLLSSSAHDRRWVKVKRPTVIVGGELTMDGLEIRHDPRSNVSEAPLQMKSNCGSLLIDDFGRQRIEPRELLNRWIVPLESGFDLLTLPTGKKIQVPFEQLILFSTNLKPDDLVDEAFLRRIPYKIHVTDPDEKEFHKLFEMSAEQFKCENRREVVDYVLAKHYRSQNRPLRRCHPRDLLMQVRNYCVFQDLPVEMRPEYFDYVATSFFTNVCDSQ
ncbi:MAG: AAA family ATPase [Planctomycetales bacterium]|nr:AAA family ATPase [Planctomycetales bacterium]